MNARSRTLLFLAATACYPGCTLDYDSFEIVGQATPSAGGAAGTDASAGGAAGQSGGAGSGQGGTAGEAGGGTGGSSGAPGTGGNPGTGGTAGEAGNAGTGGTAGSSGAAPDAGPEAGITCTDPGGQLWSQNGHCYFLAQGQGTSWQGMSDACTAAGAHLATITSAEEQAFVEPLVTGSDRWIGLSRQNSEPWGDWVTGEPYSYTNWNNGEPNESSTSCARVRASDGRWADRACNNSYGGLCERE